MSGGEGGLFAMNGALRLSFASCAIISTREMPTDVCVCSVMRVYYALQIGSNSFEINDNCHHQC